MKYECTFELHGWCACALHPFYCWPFNKCFVIDQLPCCQCNGLNTTFCRPASDTLLSNHDTEKLNFDTNYMTMVIACESYRWQQGSLIELNIIGRLPLTGNLKLNYAKSSPSFPRKTKHGQLAKTKHFINLNRSKALVKGIAQTLKLFKRFKAKITSLFV